MNTNLQSNEEFYGKYYTDMISAKDEVMNTLEQLCCKELNLIQHMHFRIKTPQSMSTKLEKNSLPIDAYTSLTAITDAVGIRIICNFLNDVFDLAAILRSNSNWVVVTEKDYINNPKINGYRSYHVILKIQMSQIIIPVEIQIRTISQDAWASLEHQIKYKKDIPHHKLIQSELKRCADELASTDSSMQTIRELIETDSL